jgi:hypothetical protein
MRAHTATVAVACSLAIFALAASAPGATAQRFAYCRADAERLCPGERPGGGRLAKCLKAHEDEVSIGCAKELKKVKAEMGK